MSSWYYHWIEWGRAALFLCILFLAAATFVFWYDPEPHEHLEYRTFPVLQTFDLTAEDGYVFRAIIGLPDGGHAVLKAKSFGRTAWITDTACAEVRVTKSGKNRYKLAAPDRCKTPDG